MKERCIQTPPAPPESWAPVQSLPIAAGGFRPENPAVTARKVRPALALSTFSRAINNAACAAFRSGIIRQCLFDEVVEWFRMKQRPPIVNLMSPPLVKRCASPPVKIRHGDGRRRRACGVIACCRGHAACLKSGPHRATGASIIKAVNGKQNNFTRIPAEAARRAAGRQFFNPFSNLFMHDPGVEFHRV